MMRLWDALKSIRSSWIPLAEVRAEAWSLGVRHRGEVIDGARAELLAAGISPHRSLLLRAVIRSQKSKRRLLGRKAATKRTEGD